MIDVYMHLTGDRSNAIGIQVEVSEVIEIADLGRHIGKLVRGHMKNLKRLASPQRSRPRR